LSVFSRREQWNGVKDRGCYQLPYNPRDTKKIPFAKFGGLDDAGVVVQAGWVRAAIAVEQGFGIGVQPGAA
jgi:hypothetical protein